MGFWRESCLSFGVKGGHRRMGNVCVFAIAECKIILVEGDAFAGRMAGLLFRSEFAIRKRS